MSFRFIALLGTAPLFFASAAQAQSVFGSTSVSVNPTAGTVTATCETDLDADAENYYEAVVHCTLVDDSGAQVGYGQYIDHNGVLGYAQAVVTVAGVPGTTYTATGQHLAVVTLGDYAQPDPHHPPGYYYLDEYNFGFYESGPVGDYPEVHNWYGPGPPQERRASSIHTGDTTDQGNLKGNFNVAYSAYIAVDHVSGPSLCTYGMHLTNHIYLGDASRNTYRATESLTIVPARSKTLGDFFPDTGFTRQYGYGSPVNGSTISGADEDGTPNDCHLWTAQGKAYALGFLQSASFNSQSHTGSVEFSGQVSDPLETKQLQSVVWDVKTTIDISKPGSPKATVTYSHTCYPAHQVKINDAVVYSYIPVRNDIAFIAGCLTFHTGMVSGTISASVTTK